MKIEEKAGHLPSTNTWGFSPTDIRKQIRIIRGIFGYDIAGALRFVENGLPDLPVGFETWAAIPTRDGKSVQETIRESLKVSGVDTRLPGRQHRPELGMTLDSEVSRLLERLAEKQETGSIAVVPVQFGRKYRGVGPFRAQGLLEEGEVGLGFSQVGALLLNHPDRLRRKRAGVWCATRYKPTYYEVTSGEKHGILFSGNDKKDTIDMSSQFPVDEPRSGLVTAHIGF